MWRAFVVSLILLMSYQNAFAASKLFTINSTHDYQKEYALEFFDAPYINRSATLTKFESFDINKFTFTEKRVKKGKNRMFATNSKSQQSSKKGATLR